MAVNPVTSHSATDYQIRAFLSQRGVIGLRYVAGYKPRKLSGEPDILPPVADVFAACSDAMLAALCREQILDGNPRVPYFLLAWHLVGSDNEQRVLLQGEQPFLIRLVALMALYIGCGALPQTRKLYRIADYAAEKMQNTNSPVAKTIAWTAEALLAAATIDNRADIEEAAWVISKALAGYGAICQQACDWCYIDDVEAGRIARKLMLDCLQ